MLVLYERVKVSVYRLRSFMQLIKHFSQFSNRTALVRELRIGTSMVSKAYMSTEFALSAAPVNFLIREANCLGLQVPPGGVDLCGTFESLLVDVILCQLPAIRKLVVCLPWTMTTPHDALAEFDFNMINDMFSDIIPLQYATRLPKGFALSSLQHLEALLPMDPQPTFLSRLHKESLTTLLRHAPALTHLRVGLCESQQVRGIVQDVLPNLKAIHLDGASNSDLAAITRFCPKLERCRLAVGVCKEYEWALQFAMQKEMSFSPDTRPLPSSDHFFLRLLLPLRSTLRELNVEWNKIGIPEFNHLAQVSHFRALRSLRLVLWTWPDGDSSTFIDSLPVGIESLCLWGREIPVYDIAVLLCKCVREGRLVSLKYFRHAPGIQEKRVEEVVEHYNGAYVHGTFQGPEERVVKVLKEAGVDCAEEVPDLEVVDGISSPT